MDLNEYWQENKRFLAVVAAGALAFLVGELVIDGMIGGDLALERREISRARAELRKGRYTAADLETARDENEALLVALDELVELVDFEPRPEYRLDAARGSATTQYFARVSAARDELLRAAGRLNVRLPEELGMPALAPTREEEIERYLEALDLVERACRLVLEEGVPRVDRIGVRLDPGLGSRRGVGRVERTRVEMRLSGPSDALAAWFLATQDPGRGGPLLIEQLEMLPERGKEREARLDLTFLVARVRRESVEEDA